MARPAVSAQDASRPLWRIYLAFLGPMVLANILQSLSGSVNAVYIGQMLGTQALAAVAGMFPIVFFFIALMVCGAILLWHARTGGYREMEEVEGEESPDWINFVWVSAGLLLNAGLIEHLGFIISCTLAYVLAVQGLRRAYGKPHDTWLVDVITGFLISAPVYWLFTKFLAINLPGLTSTGWI